MEKAGKQALYIRKFFNWSFEKLAPNIINIQE